jgi:hypothetical protein
VVAWGGSGAGRAGDRLPEQKPTKTKAPEPVEVRFTDNSTMRLTLKDENLEVATRYGRLTVPVADVRRIDFATRITDDVAKRIDGAVANLNNPQFKLRQAASAELRGFREKAYTALQHAAKSSDQETARRAEEILEWLREAVSPEQLEVRPNDIIQTDDMKISGRIAAVALKVDTFQFGELSLKLSDVRSLRSPSMVEPEAVPKNVLADPGTLTNLHNQIGKTFHFRVTGSVQGTIWGTDTYTSDSPLATAAVHAGAVQPGQTGIVKVTIVPPLPAFNGSTRHGVTSSAYGPFPGAYQIVK